MVSLGPAMESREEGSGSPQCCCWHGSLYCSGGLLQCKTLTLFKGRGGASSSGVSSPPEGRGQEGRGQEGRGQQLRGSLPSGGEGPAAPCCSVL